MTWSELVRLQPKLRLLESDIRGHARAHRREPDYCAHRYWYGYYHSFGFKDRMCNLVGYGQADPVLVSGEAYDCAYEHLYNLLPNCRHEGICR